MRYLILTLQFLALTALITGCTSNNATKPEAEEISDYTIEALFWADSMSMSMTPRQLAGQMVIPAFYATQDMLRSPLPALYADTLATGGVMLLKGDTTSARSLADTLQQMAHTPMLIAIDAEWGLSMRLSDAPGFPTNGTISPLADDQLLYDYGFELAREARSIGINMVLGPVLDIATPGSPIGRRSFGCDARRVASLGTAYARGLEDGNVISVAKHFPGLGRGATDTHTSRTYITASRRELDSADLLPFREYISSELSAIMVGHASYKALDTTLMPAAISHAIISDLLRKEMKFQGLIITDAMNMRGLGKTSQPLATAILAGADMVLAPEGTRAGVEELLNAMRSGVLPLRVARERVSRILFFKYRLGLTGAGPQVRGSAPLHSPEAAAIARKLRAK